MSAVIKQYVLTTNKLYDEKQFHRTETIHSTANMWIKIHNGIIVYRIQCDNACFAVHISSLPISLITIFCGIECETDIYEIKDSSPIWLKSYISQSVTTKQLAEFHAVKYALFLRFQNLDQFHLTHIISLLVR